MLYMLLLIIVYNVLHGYLTDSFHTSTTTQHLWYIDFFFLIAETDYYQIISSEIRYVCDHQCIF